jgi:hypothetical protein
MNAEAGIGFSGWRSGDPAFDFSSWMAVSLPNCHFHHIHSIFSISKLGLMAPGLYPRNRMMLVIGHLTGWLMAYGLRAANRVCTLVQLHFNFRSANISLLLTTP